MSFFDRLKASLNPNIDDPDNRIRSMLNEQGDDGTKVRMVKHLACFNNQADADAFIAFVEGLGYGLLDETEEEYCVAFEREAKVAGEEFDVELAVLRERALDLDGQYDGWGCNVIVE